MFERLKYWLYKLFGIKTDVNGAVQESQEKKYEFIGGNGENFTAIISNRLANLVFGDSTMRVVMKDGGTESERVVLIRETLEQLFCDEGLNITAQTFGKGGKVLVPYVSGGEVRVSTISQSRMLVRRWKGNAPDAVTLILDSVKQDEIRYFLLADYDLQGTTLTIRYRVVNERDGECEPGMIGVWADITEQITITNVKKLPIAYMKCPRDTRRDDHKSGVPITFGCDGIIRELEEHIGIYRREFKLTRPMLGLDSTLFRSREGVMQPTSIDTIRRTVQDGEDPFIPFESNSMDGKSMWQLYAPNIRQQQMEERYQSLLRRLERACGLSQGILTERNSSNSYTNRDEVRAAQYDTYTVVCSMRDEWRHALEDLAEAIDVLAERFHLTAAGSRGQYQIEFDWDMSMVESSQQTYAQMSELQAGGMVSKAELRAWVMGGSIEDAQKAIDEMADDQSADADMDNFLKSMGADEEMTEE